jgi:hypothetical protein
VPDALHRRRDQRAEHDPGHERDQQQALERRRDRVPRLGPDVVGVQRVAARERLGGAAVDGPDLDGQPRRQPHPAEPRAPVDERHVHVERAVVER